MPARFPKALVLSNVLLSVVALNLAVFPRGVHGSCHLLPFSLRRPAPTLDGLSAGQAARGGLFGMREKTENRQQSQRARGRWRWGPLAMADRWYGRTYDRWGSDDEDAYQQRKRDLARQSQRPSLTNILLGINAIVFVLQQMNPAVTFWGLKDSARVLFEGEYYRLGTAMFLHGGFPHILMNSFSLYNLGQTAEALFGTAKMLGIYLVAGVSGNMLSTWWTPHPSLGASGAIFGLGGAIGMFLVKNKPYLSQQGDAMLQSLIFNLGLNLFFGLNSSMIDNAGHIGGLIGGAIVGYFVSPTVSRMRRRRTYY